VNIASRMKSHGQPGHVQVSEVTKKLLEAKYDFQPVGVIDIKHSVPMPISLLPRKACELSLV